MRTLIIYHSRQGFTKQYAEWIKEELNCDILEYKKVMVASLDRYDTIIFGSGIYAGNIEGLDVIKKCYDRKKMKNIVIFVVGLASPRDKETRISIAKRVEEKVGYVISTTAKIYYLQGGLRYDRLNKIYKHMINGMIKNLKKNKKKEFSVEEKIILNAKEKEESFLDKDRINNIVEYVRKTEFE